MKRNGWFRAKLTMAVHIPTPPLSKTNIKRSSQRGYVKRVSGPSQLATTAFCFLTVTTTACDTIITMGMPRSVVYYFLSLRIDRSNVQTFKFCRNDGHPFFYLFLQRMSSILNPLVHNDLWTYDVRPWYVLCPSLHRRIEVAS